MAKVLNTGSGTPSMSKTQKPGGSCTYGGAAPTSYPAKGGNSFAMPKSVTSGHSGTHGGSADRSAGSGKSGKSFAMPPNTTPSTAHPSQGGDKRKRQSPSVVVE